MHNGDACVPIHADELDELIAERVLGWRESSLGSWLDRHGDITGYVSRLPEWWSRIPDEWRQRLDNPPVIWRPTRDERCLAYLLSRLRLSGYSWRPTCDGDCDCVGATVISPSGDCVTVHEHGLCFERSLLTALIHLVQGSNPPA